MKKTAVFLGVVLALTLEISLAPTLGSAAEFSYNGSPAFTLTYPEGSTPDVEPGTVWCIKTPEQVRIMAGINPIPEGIELKDETEKRFKPWLEKLVGTTIKMADNKEITLSDGTKAYYSELEWIFPQNQAEVVSVKVTVYKDGKVVNIVGHPWKEGGVRGQLVSKAINIVKSLKFK